MAVYSTFPSEIYALIASFFQTWRLAVLHPGSPLSPCPVNKRADEIVRDFEFSTLDAREAVQLFMRQMDEGLQKDGTSLSQLPTFVTAIPTGKEEGLYLAVDLGGTNLRVCSVQLSGNKTIVINPSKPSNIPIPPEKMEAGAASELFAWVAQEVSKFLVSHPDHDLRSHRHGCHYKLGFSFSQAYEQQGINKGILLHWSKAFDIPDTIGKDVCALLQTELDNLELPVVVTALVNDATGSLLARAYETGGNPKTILGAIFGTGTNGAYLEKLENISKLDLSDTSNEMFASSTREMIVNTEWAAFDNQMLLLPNTEFDRAVDNISVNPRQEMFEKRISGLYLGEILRYAILQLYAVPPQWCYRLPRPMLLMESPLNIPWAIDSSFLSELATEGSTKRKYLDGVIASKLKTQLDKEATFIASNSIRKVSLAISRRAARLAGVAIAAIVIRSGLLDDFSNGIVEETSILYANEAELQKTSSPTLTCLKSHNIFHNIMEICHSFLPIARKTRLGVQKIAPQPSIDIGVTGSLWQKHPQFETMVRELLREIPEIGLEGEKKIRIGIAGNGSLVGAALGAALADGDK